MDFNFLRGLAPGLLDGLSIGRYEKNCESLDLFAAKFKSGTMGFSGGKSLQRWILITNSKRQTQNPSKSHKKALLTQKDDYIPQLGNSTFM